MNKGQQCEGVLISIWSLVGLLAPGCADHHHSAGAGALDGGQEAAPEHPASQSVGISNFDSSVESELDTRPEATGAEVKEGQLNPVPKGIQLTAADQQTCALREGRVFCWGARYGPGVKEISGLSDVAQVAHGGDHHCALHSDGRVSCWGSNRDGHLGIGTLSNEWLAEPVEVVGLDDVVYLAAAQGASCVVRDGGTVACWGTSVALAFGGAEATDRHAPAPLVVEGLHDVVAVTGTGFEALRADGQVVHASSGAPIEAIAPDVRTLVSSGKHSCAIHADGELTCWGHNGYGQLGNGSTDSISGEDYWHEERGGPSSVLDVSRVVDVSCGGTHTCAVTDTGAVGCWGYNLYGQVAVGAPPTPQVNAVWSELDVVRQVAVGGDTAGHTCVVQEGDRIVCWGYNAFGQVDPGQTLGTGGWVGPVQVQLPE